ncbi:hypothetical protein B0T10DRAFT_611804 [Thelonectria olida]|uniref:Putative ER transporter 6TM N-terminal domain-containing protein n=1 Tax=Thelonectria olida TaxID=1576542 RepID=A0A9P8VP87_9HYPO|nr:hypothetical protein B0T10DRAFT_611804 [Thelonectria olida]
MSCDMTHSGEDSVSSSSRDHAANPRDKDVAFKHEPAQPRRQRQWTLPAWLDYFNSSDLKILVRCWVAAWVAILLAFIQPALNTPGIATYFATIRLCISPPATLLFIYLLGALSALMGIYLALAWGLLAMKAAHATRPVAEGQARAMTLQQVAAARALQSGQSPDERSKRSSTLASCSTLA